MHKPRQVDKFFVPSGENPLNEKFNKGYYTVASKKERLEVFDLISLRTLPSVDLEDHNCLPVHLAYVPIGGWKVGRREKI